MSRASRPHWENVSGRVTWQANAKNKISGFWDEQATCRSCEGQTSGITDPARVSPEAGSVGATKPLRVMQAELVVADDQPAAPRRRVRRRLLRVGQLRTRSQSHPRTDACDRAVRRGMRQQRRHRRPVYRSQDFNVNNTGSFGWKANVSYVTGSTA